MARVQPWQIIGEANKTETTSARQLMKELNLDWKVTLEDVYTPGKFDPIKIEDKFATVRHNADGTESAIGVVGSRYKIFQNSEVFESLDFLIDSGEARYAAAGELNGGAVVWTVMEIPNGIKVEGDEHAAYILARTSHDGSSSFEIAPIVTRLSCTNQMNAAFASAKHKQLYFSLKHTQKNVVSAADIRQVINIMYEDFSDYSDMAASLLAQPMSNFEFENFAKHVYPLPSKIEFSSEELLSPGEKRARTAQLRNRKNARSVWLCETDTQHNIQGTKFAALHAIVETQDHFSRSYEKASSRILLSKDGNIKSRALELLS